MDIISFKHSLTLVFLLGIIFYSVYILAGEYFVHGFKPLTPKAFGFSLILCLAHIVYNFTIDDVIKPLFPEYILYVKLVNFVLLCLVYGFGIVLQRKRYRT